MVKGFKIFDKISDAVVIIDLHTTTICYFNEISREWFDIGLNMNIHELMASLCFEKDNRVKKEVILEELRSHQEYTIEHIKIRRLSVGIIEANVNIGYLDGDQSKLYMIVSPYAQNLEQTYLKNKYFDIIYSMSFSYPFRLEVTTKRIHFIGPIMEHFQLPPVMENYPQDLLESGFLHEDDYDVFMEIVDSMYAGKPCDQVFRCYTKDGGILWYKATYTVHTNEKNEPIEVIGEFISVQEQKELEQKVKIDELTGCLNKSVFQQYVQNIIDVSSKEESHALLMIDVDNFKSINDNLGHQFGDFVLKEIGFDLNAMVRSYDLVGRIGGDEFMVFLKNMESEKATRAICHRILDAVDKTFETKSTAYRTTASIGIAYYPKHGISFETLYKHADAALYCTKRNGKNGYTFYDDSMDESVMEAKEVIEDTAKAFAKHYDESVMYDIAVLMYESDEYDLTIQQALTYLGKRYNTSRCYIMKEILGESPMLLYEWCRDRIESKSLYELQPTKEQMHRVVQEIHRGEMINISELSTLPDDIQKLFISQEIKSSLMMLMKGKSGNNYFFGFDDCNEIRRWTDIEIGTLYSTSRVIGQALKYKETIEEN